ncbi:hypothetical protein [Ravibacter arvi]|uniref:hypothetical protein n=1 Tax=Ravibacter arvi TaxID=2051041 RepID=UPI0031E877E7
MRAGNIFFKLFMAVASGIGIGFLLAPARATRTRRRLLDKGEDYLKGVTDAYWHSLTDLKHALNSVSNRQPNLGTEFSSLKEEGGKDTTKTNNV